MRAPSVRAAQERVRRAEQRIRYLEMELAEAQQARAYARRDLYAAEDASVQPTAGPSK